MTDASLMGVLSAEGFHPDDPNSHRVGEYYSTWYDKTTAVLRSRRILSPDEHPESTGHHQPRSIRMDLGLE